MEETTMKSRINFPPPNDKIWGKVDQELNQILPTIFPDTLCNQLTPTELSQKFDSWLHNYFIDQFGTIPEKRKQTAQRKPRMNKALQTLRQQKKECKAARKALLKAGLAGTAAEKLLTKEWLSLVRKHHKLRVELKRKHQIKEKITAERSFKQNPHKFADKLFQKLQKSGTPSFSAETAFDYFQETYTDNGRDFVYTAPEGMQPPNPPSIIFSLRCPTHAEIFAKALNGREMVQHQASMLLLMFHTRSVNLSKILLLNLQEKFGEQKMSVLTGLKHLLCCYQNLVTLLQ